MERADLTDLLWFLAVAEERSFTKAAIRLGTSQSTLSSRVRHLEERLGFRLLNRTTRSVTTTEAGERLLATLAPRIAEIEGEVDALQSQRGRAAGQVRISLSEDAWYHFVWPRLRGVLPGHPDIRLEVHLDNAFRNIVEERLDAGVRLGEAVDQDMIAVRISPDWRLVTVASPAYLASHPAPQRPQDLAEHACINHRARSNGSPYAWEFRNGDEEVEIRVEGQLSFNTPVAMIDAVLGGFGVAYLPEHMVKTHLIAGTLVQVLNDWTPRFPGYYLYYPSRRQTSAAFKVILDALRREPVR